VSGGFSILIRTELDGTPATVSLTDRAMTVGHGDHLVVAWDLGGRLYSMADGHETWRRGLNGRVLVTRRVHGERQRAWLTEPDASAVVDRAARLAARVRDALGCGASAERDTGSDPPPALSPSTSARGSLSNVEGSVRSESKGVGPNTATARDILAALARASAFDSDAAKADEQAFRAVYEPVGILPPDQYLALVLQATVGCSFRSCRFCEFYRNTYRVKSAEQFKAHLDAVRRYLGDSIALRGRAVFLGSANALAVPMGGLLPIFDTVATEFPARPVSAFVDGFTGSMKAPADYRALADRGLRRVYVGLESGHDALLEFVNKPASAAQAVQTVRSIKESGVQVGAIVMLGLGGERFAEAHVSDTARAVSSMGLGEGDVLYFSELVAGADSPYGESVGAVGSRPLTAGECLAQRQAIERSIEFGHGRPRIATYDVREFVY
jgi:hypothetical protein